MAGYSFRLNGRSVTMESWIAAALANAIFDATGVRLRTVPFTAARVKAAYLSSIHPSSVCLNCRSSDSTNV